MRTPVALSSSAWRRPIRAFSLVFACGALMAAAAAAVPAAAGTAVPGPGSPRAASHDDELFAISCLHKKGCLAVGKWFDPEAKATRPLAETSTGTTWAVRNPPVPKGSDITALDAVSCVSGPAPVCLAVGQTGTSSGSQNYAALWNWSKWTLLKPPDLPSSALDQLNAVSCTSSVHCVITGHYVSGKTGHGLVSSLVWNGKTWSIEKVPAAPKGTNDWLYGISCTSKSFCLAVGDDYIHGEVQPAMAASWNGKAWKLRPAQTPKASNGTALLGVSCTSAKSCQAVGNYLNHGLAFASVGESWNGTALKLRATPDTGPSGEGSTLRGVYCLSANLCMATGTMAARWNGVSWKPLAFPQASPVLSLAYGISCTSTSNCTAAGDYTITTGALSLFAKWNGSSWKQQKGKNPN